MVGARRDKTVKPKLGKCGECKSITEVYPAVDSRKDRGRYCLGCWERYEVESSVEQQQLNSPEPQTTASPKPPTTPRTSTSPRPTRSRTQGESTTVKEPSPTPTPPPPPITLQLPALTRQVINPSSYDVVDVDISNQLLCHNCGKPWGLEGYVMHPCSHNVCPMCIDHTSSKISVSCCVCRCELESITLVGPEDQNLAHQTNVMCNTCGWFGELLEFVDHECVPRSHVQIRRESGNRYFKQGNADKAIQEYTRGIVDTIPEGRDVSVLYLNRAVVYYKFERFDLAHVDASEAVRLDPNYAKAYARRAFAAIELHHEVRAIIDDLRKALELDPDLSDVRDRLHQLELEEERQKQAEADGDDKEEEGEEKPEETEEQEGHEEDQENAQEGDEQEVYEEVDVARHQEADGETHNVTHVVYEEYDMETHEHLKHNEEEEENLAAKEDEEEVSEDVLIERRKRRKAAKMAAILGVPLDADNKPVEGTTGRRRYQIDWENIPKESQKPYCVASPSEQPNTTTSAQHDTVSSPAVPIHRKLRRKYRLLCNMGYQPEMVQTAMIESCGSNAEVDTPVDIIIATLREALTGTQMSQHGISAEDVDPMSSAPLRIQPKSKKSKSAKQRVSALCAWIPWTTALSYVVPSMANIAKTEAQSANVIPEAYVEIFNAEDSDVEDKGSTDALGERMYQRAKQQQGDQGKGKAQGNSNTASSKPSASNNSRNPVNAVKRTVRNVSSSVWSWAQHHAQVKMHNDDEKAKLHRQYEE